MVVCSNYRHVVIEAMVEELSYVNAKEVWNATSRKAAKINEGGTHVRMRWDVCKREMRHTLMYALGW